jgi:N-acetyl-gamma-glutamyl-phosphate reductase
MKLEAARVGLVGGRGYVGQEIVELVAAHPRLELAFVASTSKIGDKVADHLAGAPAALRFVDPRELDFAKAAADVVILGLANGEAPRVAKAIEAATPAAVIVDVSADHRFDDAWVWGLPELRRGALSGARRIANPGCYATAASLALAPMAALLAGPAHVFGVSGYSGAGATPSPRNDVERLRDNLMPYAMVGHTHEREVSRHVAPVFFVPHVASFFQGLTVTVSMTLRDPIGIDALNQRYHDAYGDEPLVELTGEPPFVRDVVERPGALVGGFAVDEARSHAVVVAVLDNLLKGAASQAIQNVNLALGLPELAGIGPWPA